MFPLQNNVCWKLQPSWQFFNAIYHLWDQVFNYIDPRQFLKRIILIIRVDLKFFKRKEVSFNVLPQVEGELDFIFERAAEKLGRGITL